MPFWSRLPTAAPPTLPTPPSSSTTNTSDSPSSSIPQASASSNPPPTSSSSSSSASSTTSSSTSTSTSQSPINPHNDFTDAELTAFLNSINSSAIDPEAPNPAAPKTMTSPPTFSAADRARIQAASQSGDAADKFESTFPTTMNCMHAFDQVWYCYSLGGQFLNVYRYGTLRDCSDKSADWRFCMRTKMYGPATRKAMIMARYKEKAARYKKGLSSEDVWALRREPLENAFSAWADEDPADDVVASS